MEVSAQNKPCLGCKSRVLDLCEDVSEGRVWEADGEEALTTDAEENVHDG